MPLDRDEPKCGIASDPTTSGLATVCWQGPAPSARLWPSVWDTRPRCGVRQAACASNRSRQTATAWPIRAEAGRGPLKTPIVPIAEEGVCRIDNIRTSPGPDLEHRHLAQRTGKAPAFKPAHQRSHPHSSRRAHAVPGRAPKPGLTDAIRAAQPGFVSPAPRPLGLRPGRARSRRGAGHLKCLGGCRRRGTPRAVRRRARPTGSRR